MNKHQLCAALLAAALAAGSVPAALAIDGATAVTSSAADSIVSGRLADLDTLLQTLESKHPNLYTQHTKAEFDAKRAEIEQNLATMSDFDFAIALSELVALVGDSHTMVSIGTALGQSARFLPLNLAPMGDGLVITGLPAEYAEFLGGTLTAINGIPLEQVEERISPMLSADNDARRHRQFYGTF